VALSVGVLLTACGGSDNKKGNKSSSSVAVSSVKSSAAPVSSAAPMSSSVASSSVASSMASSVAESSVASSSSEASSMASSSSSSSDVCSQNPDSVIPCDASKWVVDGGNGGSIEQGESGPIFINGAPTGTDPWNKPGMFFVLDNPGIVMGKTLTLIVIVDPALKDTGAAIQPVIQEQGNDYEGFWDCQTNNEDLVVGGETEVVCEHTGSVPVDDIAQLRLGIQLNASTSYEGTIEVVDAIWE
jgi:hypothetical protein